MSGAEESSRRAAWEDIQKQKRSFIGYEGTGSRLRGVIKKNCHKLERPLLRDCLTSVPA
jgi:hypothetical protein